MKLTDFALIFVGVTLPIIIVVYINISYGIKAEEQEMYYQKLVDGAMQDATNQMKEVENTDKQIDYGYSGVWDKKVSVNAQVAVDTFLNSLYNNFNIKGNDAAEKYLQLFIPAIAVVDYNGVQISSIEQYTGKDENGNSTTLKSHVLKPKRYYTYTYGILKNPSGGYTMTDDASTINSSKNVPNKIMSIHTIEFTMDDYISSRGTYYDYTTATWKDISIRGFYTSDTANNSSLFDGSGVLSGDDRDFVNSTIVPKLTSIRKDVIANTVRDEMAYAVNKNNSYARAAGISYNFTFPQVEKNDWYNEVSNIGIIAFMQGLSIGNKYLNYKAYGITRLDLTTKYYLTTWSVDSKIKTNLYHKDTNCPEYKLAHPMDTPQYVTSKQQAASAIAEIGKTPYSGFSPCPICNP